MPARISYTNVHRTPSILIRSRYNYFKLEDFACKGTNCCGNSISIQSTLVEFCDELRGKLKRPLRVNSAFRCSAHNRAVGGATESQHMYGNAVDLSLYHVGPDWLDDFMEFVVLVHSYNLPGCGIYYNPDGARSFVHCDIREGAQSRWGQINGVPHQYAEVYEAVLLKKILEA